MNPPASHTPILLDQHALFVGVNGSGKSTRMELMVQWRLSRMRGFSPQSYKIIIVDTKPISYGQQEDLGHYASLGGVIFRTWEDFDVTKVPGHLVIYRPMPDQINPEDFGHFFDKLRGYRYRNSKGNLTPLAMTIVVDELIDIITSPSSRRVYIEGLTKLLTEGRSALQTLWILTQYPVYIDAGIKRNARVNFVFRLPDEDDRKLMAGVLGSKKVKDSIRFRHGFWYQSDAIEATMTEPWFFNGQGNVVSLGRRA